MIAMSAIISPTEDLRVEYADASGQTTDPGAIIDSVEATLNVNNNVNVVQDSWMWRSHPTPTLREAEERPLTSPLSAESTARTSTS